MGVGSLAARQFIVFTPFCLLFFERIHQGGPISSGFGEMQLYIEMNLKMARRKEYTFINNQPTVTVASASSLCASPFSLYATL
jgi:hypothetical protein